MSVTCPLCHVIIQARPLPEITRPKWLNSQTILSFLKIDDKNCDDSFSEQTENATHITPKSKQCLYKQRLKKYVLFEPWRPIEPVLISGFCSTKRTGGIHPQDRMQVYCWILPLAMLRTPLTQRLSISKKNSRTFASFYDTIEFCLFLRIFHRPWSGKIVVYECRRRADAGRSFFMYRRFTWIPKCFCLKDTM